VKAKDAPHLCVAGRKEYPEDKTRRGTRSSMPYCSVDQESVTKCLRKQHRCDHRTTYAEKAIIILGKKLLWDRDVVTPNRCRLLSLSFVVARHLPLGLDATVVVIVCRFGPGGYGPWTELLVWSRKVRTSAVINLSYTSASLLTLSSMSLI